LFKSSSPRTACAKRHPDGEVRDQDLRSSEGPRVLGCASRPHRRLRGRFVMSDTPSAADRPSDDVQFTMSEDGRALEVKRNTKERHPRYHDPPGLRPDTGVGLQGDSRDHKVARTGTRRKDLVPQNWTLHRDGEYGPACRWRSTAAAARRAGRSASLSRSALTAGLVASPTLLQANHGSSGTRSETG